jgi:hypothetical protein
LCGFSNAKKEIENKGLMHYLGSDKNNCEVLNKDIEKMFLFLWEIGREMNM